MSGAATATISKFALADNPRKAILDKIGKLDNFTVMQNMVLVATYVRPEKTKGGIIRPDSNVQEDQWQGKVGLVLKKGPMAFVDDDYNSFLGQNVNIGEWVGYRVGDAWSLNINDVPCRLVEDSMIRFKIDDPSEIF